MFNKYRYFLYKSVWFIVKFLKKEFGVFSYSIIVAMLFFLSHFVVSWWIFFFYKSSLFLKNDFGVLLRQYEDIYFFYNHFLDFIINFIMFLERKTMYCSYVMLGYNIYNLHYVCSFMCSIRSKNRSDRKKIKKKKKNTKNMIIKYKGL